MNVEDYRMQMLVRLAQDRPVFVYAAELGPIIPIVRGFEDCLPLFDPWNHSFRASYHSGSVGWSLPLDVLLSRLPREKILSAVKNSDSGWMRGRPWPCSMLKYAAEGRAADAFRLLTSTIALIDAGPGELISAAACWFYIMGNSQFAREALEEAAARISETDSHDLHWIRLARSWIEMFGNRNRANDALREEIRWLSEDKEDYPVIEMDLLYTLYFCMEDHVGAKEFLPDATRLMEPSCTWDAIDAAFLWLTLFDEKAEASACAALARTRPEDNSGSWAAFIWNCALLDAPSARRCLEQSDTPKASSSALLDVAEGWMLHFEDQEAAARLLESVEKTVELGGADMRLGPYWYSLLNHIPRSAAFIEMIKKKNDTLHLVLLAMACKRFGASDAALPGKLIELAESAVKTVSDWVHCGTARWNIEGNYQAFKRCMKKALDETCTAEELWYVTERERKICPYVVVGDYPENRNS